MRTQYALTPNKHPDRSIYEALVEELAKRDPEAAQKWLGELEGGDRAPALEAMARMMVRSDVEGLVGTLSEVPRDEGWAAGVRVLIDDLKSSDPKTSATWTEVLENRGFDFWRLITASPDGP
ncbi:hypothetical protein V2O64_04340 [Verrucomicrobiaceae bacterium 227]